MRVCNWTGCFRNLPIGGKSKYCREHAVMADEWTCPVCEKLISPAEPHETTGTIIYHRACYIPKHKGRHP